MLIQIIALLLLVKLIFPDIRIIHCLFSIVKGAICLLMIGLLLLLLMKS